MEFSKEDNEAVEWCEKTHSELCVEYKKIMMEQYVMFISLWYNSSNSSAKEIQVRLG